MKITKPIMRDCIFCGKPISIKSGQELPAGIEFIKAKRGTVLLVHTDCVNNMNRIK